MRKIPGKKGIGPVPPDSEINTNPYVGDRPFESYFMSMPPRISESERAARETELKKYPNDPSQ